MSEGLSIPAAAFYFILFYDKILIMNYGKNSIKKKQEELSSPQGAWNNYISYWAIRIILIAIAVVMLILIVNLIGFMQSTLNATPSVSEVLKPKTRTTVVLDTDGDQIASFSRDDLVQKDVSLDQVPKDLQNAFIADKDEDFYSHRGIRIQSLFGTWFNSWLSRGDSEADTTITSLLISNYVYFGVNSGSSSDAVRLSMEQQYLSSLVEKERSKKWILEHYLNSVQMGNGVAGVEAASERYFGKQVSDLTLAECASLAASTENPEDDNPLDNPRANKTKRNKILRKMLEQDYITEKQYEDAVSTTVSDYVTQADMHSDSATNTSCFSEVLKQQILNDLCEQQNCTQAEAENYLYSGGLTIYSTLDSDLQETCTQAVNNAGLYDDSTFFSMTYRLSVRTKDGKVENYDETDVRDFYKQQDPDYKMAFSTRNGVRTAAAVFRRSMVDSGETVIAENLVISPEPQSGIVLMSQTTGEVKALVGCRTAGDQDPAIDRVSTEIHDPGTILNVPVIYAAALESGDYTLSDKPSDYSSTGTGAEGTSKGSSRNGSDKNSGVTIHEAIADRHGKTTAKMRKLLGTAKCTEYLEKFCLLTSEDAKNRDSDLLKQTSVLSVDAAYAAIASGGIYHVPVCYSKVIDRSDTVILNKEIRVNASYTTIKETTAYLLTQAMKDSVEAGEAKGGMLENMPAAAQAGYSKSGSDAWYAGFTPYYTCTVWSGADDTQVKASRDTPARIWKQVMESAHKDMRVTDFKQPDGIVRRKLCSVSHLLAIDGVCPETQEEYYSAGTEPDAKCNLHETAVICSSSGLLAGPYCPESAKQTKTFLRDASDPKNRMPDRLCNVHTSASKN